MVVAGSANVPRFFQKERPVLCGRFDLPGNHAAFTNAP
jgi:hypothetical protein